MESRRYFKLNDMELQCIKLWDIANPVHRGKFIVLNAYIRNSQRLKIDDLEI